MMRRRGDWLAHIGFLASALAIAGGGWALYGAAATVRASSQRTDLTLETIQRASSLEGAMSRAEAAQRGFLLSADSDDLRERDASIDRAKRELARLDTAMTDPAQRSRVEALEGLLERRVERMREAQRLRDERGPAYAGQRFAAGEGHRLSAQLHDGIEAIARADREELERLRASENADYERALSVLVATIFLSLLVTAPAYAGFLAQRRARNRVERRFAELAELLPGAVFQYRVPPDGRGRYEFLSGGTEAVRGVKREEAMRDPEVILGTIPAPHRQAMLERLERREPFEHDFPVRDAGGGERWLRVSSAPRVDPDGSVLWSGHWTDVSEKRAAQKALEDAKAAADAANRAKSTFLATMSHEIRTPMNGVLGMLELLSLTRLEAEQRNSLNIVRESGRSLLRIIDDILDFSKVEAGKLELAPEATSLPRLVERIADMYVGTASSKGLLLRRELDPALPQAVMVDAVRLQQVLGNLLANAIKFTDAGEVTLRAEAMTREPDGRHRVRFTVTDTGVGMTPEQCARLFEPFTQADAATSRRYGGTGLGLSICRRLAELMGGRIEVQSERSRGTSVAVTVSLVDADPALVASTQAAGAPPAQLEAPPPAIAKTARGRVLVVDDHPVNRVVMVKQVEALGYGARAAADGAEALEYWRQGGFAAVLTDCNMPGMDGYELARRIREREGAEGHARTPIIACTANALSGEAANCYAAGMDDYVAKPVDLPGLARKLSYWIGHESGGTVLDERVLAEAAGGDHGMERDLLAQFRQYNDTDVHSLEQAAAAADAQGIARAAHRIKGAGRTVGAEALAAVAAGLEDAARHAQWHLIGPALPALRREVGRLNTLLESRLR